MMKFNQLKTLNRHKLRKYFEKINFFKLKVAHNASLKFLTKK